LKDHLGSIRVVLNSTNTVVSAQDYDAWGYPLENRTYNTNTMKYDFTSKEHDQETSYDYFGVRYYDSRIGRWGGVEPLLDKYLNFSPYIYTINNPLIFNDRKGMDIYIRGSDWEDIYDELNDYFKDSKMVFSYDKIDNNTIKLKYSGNATSEVENLLKDAMDSDDIINLYSLDNNYFTEKGQDHRFAIGAFGGSNKTGEIFQANQYINMKSARDFAGMPDAPSVASSIVHEILEAIVGQRDFRGLGYNYSYYESAHNKTTLMQSERTNYEERFYYDNNGVFKEVKMYNIEYNKEFELYKNK